MDLNFKLLIIYPFYSNGYVMCQNMVFLIRFIVGSLSVTIATCFTMIPSFGRLIRHF